MRKSTLASLGLSISLALSACGRSTPAQPSTPNPSPSTTERTLEGVVLDTALQGVSGAHVEIVNGSGAGTSVASNQQGLFTMSGRFAEGEKITLRATRQGYFDINRTVSIPLGPTWIELLIKSMARPADLTGRYVVTMTAADECSAKLPEAVRSRTYTASLARGQAEETFSGTLLAGPSNGRPLTASVAGNSATLWIGIVDYGIPGVLEDLGTGYLFIAGDATTVVSIAGIGGTVRGDWMYCPRDSARFSSNDQFACQQSVVQSCNSAKHQILLTAR